jgi:hypothetical protein
MSEGFKYFLRLYPKFSSHDDFRTKQRAWEDSDCIPQEMITDWPDDYVFIRKGNGQGATTSKAPWYYPTKAKYKFCVQLDVADYPSWQRTLTHEECTDFGFDVMTGRSDVHPFFHANADAVYLRLKELYGKTIRQFYDECQNYRIEQWPDYRSWDMDMPSTATGKPRVRYGEYIKSDVWLEKRHRVWRRDGMRCVECGSAMNLQCHHLTYENLGNEPLQDLVTLCRSCHSEKHDRGML